MAPMTAHRIAALLAAASCAGAFAAPGERNPQVTRIVEEISPQRIEAIIRKLVSFGTRNSLSETESQTRGIGAARRWIKGYLEDCSKATPLQVAFDSHHIESAPRVPKPTDFVNVVSTLPANIR